MVKLPCNKVFENDCICEQVIHVLLQQHLPDHSNICDLLGLILHVEENPAKLFPVNVLKYVLWFPAQFINLGRRGKFLKTELTEFVIHVLELHR